MLDQYFHQVRELMNLIQHEEGKAIQQAASTITDCIQADGIVHVFGCGHSHMLSEEVFYRAGGLVPIQPILIEDVMLHKGAFRSSAFERKNEFADSFMKDIDIRPSDVVIIGSTSGINPVPIDVARIAKEKGAYVVAITSMKYANKQPSRHTSGEYLFQQADLVINNHISVGDALLHESKSNLSFGSGSTVMGMVIINAIMAEATSEMIKNGFTPPVFKSGNVDGADEHNKKLMEKYKSRIPLLGM